MIQLVNQRWFASCFLIALSMAIVSVIAGCQESSTSANSGAGLATSTAEDADAKIMYREDGVAEVSFDALKFEFRADGSYSDDDVTPEIKALVGKPVVIRGYILPALYQDKGFTQFVLIRDNLQCCFGPGAKLYHNMQIEMVNGATADYTTFPVTVEGKFELSPFIAPDGKCYSVFKCSATSARQ